MRGLLTLLMAIAAGMPASAQDISLAPSPAVRCLTPPVAERGKPEYPFDPLKFGEGGTVEVELIFTTPDLRPQVDVIDSQGHRHFVDAVKAHVSKLRVPCLEHADIPVRLRQKYVFSLDSREVTWSTPVDVADPERRQRLACIVRTGLPDYPIAARRHALSGRVLIEMRFVQPERPPEIKVYSVGNASVFERSASQWAESLRMPCVGTSPVSVLYTAVYRIEDAPAFGFGPLTLQQFMASIVDLRSQRVKFDTTTMGCPFDVGLHYLQPHLPNTVGQSNPVDPRRQPLLDWLSQARLKLSRDQNESVFADTALIRVPCIRIDLNPQEKS